MNQDADRENECWESSQVANGTESALWAIAAGLYALSGNTLRAAKHLGTQDAATPMGALEHASSELKGIAEAIREFADGSRS